MSFSLDPKFSCLPPSGLAYEGFTVGKKSLLRAKLKAADKRRKRRLPSTATQQVKGELTDTEDLEQASTRVNPMDLIASTILKHVNQPESSARDVVVISTMKRILRGSSPVSPEEVVLSEKLSKIPERADIDQRKYRKGLEDILEIAGQQQSSNTPDAFLQYLTILSQ